nr:hypothetical protein [Pandoravirus belohorizontensis]
MNRASAADAVSGACPADVGSSRRMDADQLMDAVYVIVHYARPHVSIDTLRSEWDHVRESAIAPNAAASAGDPHTFVVLMHEYFRAHRALPFASGAWNFFGALMDAAQGCNCACSTVLILLACAEVGLFGRFSAEDAGDARPQVWAATISNHVFLLAGDGDGEPVQMFETTFACRTNWVSADIYCRALDQGPGACCYATVKTHAALASLCARSASHTMAPDRARPLLDAYPDPNSPSWWGARIRALTAAELDRPLYPASMLSMACASSVCMPAFSGELEKVVRGALDNVRFSTSLLADGSLAEACHQIAAVFDRSVRQYPETIVATHAEAVRRMAVQMDDLSLAARLLYA